MQYTAKWGPKGFLVSPTMVVPFMEFSTSLTLKEDSKDDTSGTAKTNKRGRELRPISFSTTYLRAVGVDPRAQSEAWEAELGNSYPLYVGGKQVGTNPMMLTAVNTSDVKFAPTGEWISCKVALTLKEYANGNETVLLKSANSSDTEKKTAMQATAPKATKQKKKVPATHAQMVAAAGKRRQSNARPR